MGPAKRSSGNSPAPGSHERSASVKGRVTLSLRGGRTVPPALLWMKYKFTIDESTEPPAKNAVEFRARTVERAYKFVIQYIVHDPGNKPLKRGTLWKLDAFVWEALMVWKRGPGWGFPDGRESDVIDKRIAPGS